VQHEAYDNLHKADDNSFSKADGERHTADGNRHKVGDDKQHEAYGAAVAGTSPTPTPTLRHTKACRRPHPRAKNHGLISDHHPGSPPRPRMRHFARGLPS
jgi:hypothetical protein